jgi:hypothetical protein
VREVNTNVVAQINQLFAGLAPAREVAAGSWRLGQAVDLAAMQASLRRPAQASDGVLQALRATPAGRPEADLLFVIRQHATELEEIRAASHRPHARFGLPSPDLIAVVLPHLSIIKSFSQTFRIKALAELAASNPDAAMEDVLAGFRLANTLREEPFLIATLVEFAVADLSVQPLWEGLVRHQWQDRHLAACQVELARLNFVADMARALRGERVYCIAALEALGHGPTPRPPGEAVPSVFRRLPGGFIDQNKVHIARIIQDSALPILDPVNRLVDLRANSRFDAEIDRLSAHKTPYNVFAALLFPALKRVADKVAYVQSAVNLAVVACALERHRLAEGAYPEKLEALAPRFLPAVPLDTVTGKLPAYRRTAPDRFTLYAIGLSGEDHGGKLVFEKGKPQLRARDSDWPWPCTAQAPMQ